RDWSPVGQCRSRGAGLVFGWAGALPGVGPARDRPTGAKVSPKRGAPRSTELETAKGYSGLPRVCARGPGRANGATHWQTGRTADAELANPGRSGNIHRHAPRRSGWSRSLGAPMTEPIAFGLMTADDVPLAAEVRFHPRPQGAVVVVHGLAAWRGHP